MSYKILNGNELLIQGALEAGFQLYTGYPGSPLADFFNILHEKKDEMHQKGARVVIANSEANAAAMASGAKMAGQNVLVAMKSMGLHVASDALSVGNFANPGADSGVVVAVGDDPWSISTSTPADSRYLFKHLHIPFFEPSTPQELKDWMKIALVMSQDTSVYVGYILTTFMAEGGGRVEVHPEKEILHEKVTLDPKTFNLSANVMVPPNSLLADKEMIINRFPRVYEALAKLNLDQIHGNENSDTAVISAGGVFETLKQVLEESELLQSFALYKAATTYPFNEAQLLPFLKTKKRVLVVEEKRGFLENELRAFITKHNLEIEIHGKEFRHNDQFVEGFPAYGGLNYEIIYQKLNVFLTLGEKASCLSSKADPVKLDLVVPRRLPTFCPGCPHRETLSVMKDVRASLASEDINLISHGDVGCYSLSFLEPFKEMHDLSAMGQGGALGAGTDLFTTNPSVVLMGDSTFFHSGMTSISNSVQMGHNITYILLDNDNTAMTGHQMTPVSGLSVEGDKRPRQSMIEVAKSLKVSEALEVNPSDRYFYKNLLLDFVKRDGVKVIVSNKECGLTFHGRKKRDERKLFSKGETEAVREFYQINTEACEDCRACVEMTGCPGLSQTQDAYGPRVMIDPQICVADSYCTKIKACPSFELVKVYDYHPTKYRPVNASVEFSFSDPKLTKDLTQIASGDDFRAVVIGVGGSGVTTISRVLAEASETMGGRDDLSFKFVDQKGLAQRNGSVSSHLAIFSKNKSHGPLVPVGTADVVLSPDLLEGSRAIEFLSPKGLLIIDDDYQVPLSILLDRGIDHEIMTPEKLQTELKAKLGDRLVMAPMKRLAFERFGRSVYASAMVLGIAFQKGVLPFSLEDLKKAFTEAVPRAEMKLNWEAFEMGREWVNSGSAPVQNKNELQVLEKSVAMVAFPWQRKDRMIRLWKGHLEVLKFHFPTIPVEHLARYIHDLLVFDQGKGYAAFLEDAIELKKKYSSDVDVALRALVKTYFIKDEIFVSHQMISPMKLERDKLQYQNLGTSFKVVHINRPAFDIGTRKIEFDFSPKFWMLRLMRHARFLRAALPEWHKREREISGKIRQEILSGVSLVRLNELDSIKGYREIRYKAAEKYGL